MTGRGLVVDLRPLRRSAPFRRLWAGSLLSAVGNQVAAFAVALQVFQLTGSAVAVGGIGLANAVPAVVLGLLGGSVIDAGDRRAIVLWSTVGLAGCSAALAALSWSGVRLLWPLYLIVVIGSLLSTLNLPARRTFLPRLFGPDLVPAASALMILVFHLSAVAGPLLAGAIAAAGGLTTCYLIDTVAFVAALWGVAGLPAMPPEGGGTRAGPAAVLAGLRFIRDRRVLAGALLADVSATFLGMPVALFPVINAERFGGSPHTLGVLASGLAVGGVIGGLLSGAVTRLRRPGAGMLVAGALWGVGLIGFGLAGQVWAATACLVVAGAADVNAVVLRVTIIQLATPDAYRGRTAAAEHVVGNACPQLGNFRAGAVASAFSPGISAVAGGIAVVAGAGLIALSLPAFVRHRPAAGPDRGAPDRVG